MRTLEQIRNLPMDQLTTDECCLLPYDEWRAKADERRAKEAACAKHEMISTSTWDQSRRGDHRGHCKHCGMNMSYDSGG